MKNKHRNLTIIIIIVVVIVALVTYAYNHGSNLSEDKESSVMKEKEAAVINNNEKDSMSKKTIIGYKGELLAGNESPYLVFNKEDYDKALSENKTILLYFYANWCPECKIEQPETISAFNEMKNKNLIGFRVNYKDSDTDNNEIALAKEFGISYQHTKVIIKGGVKLLKAPDSWNKDRYLEELNKFS